MAASERAQGCHATQRDSRVMQSRRFRVAPKSSYSSPLLHSRFKNRTTPPQCDSSPIRTSSSPSIKMIPTTYGFNCRSRATTPKDGVRSCQNFLCPPLGCPELSYCEHTIGAKLNKTSFPPRKRAREAEKSLHGRRDSNNADGTNFLKP